MGGLFSGLQERRTDALVRLAYDIKQTKLNIDSNNSRRRKTRIYLSWLYLSVPVAFSVFMFILDASWVFAAVYTLPFGLLIILVNYMIKWHFARDLRRNEATLRKLKDEKRQVLEEIKNTENYRVAKDLLDKYDHSGDETEANLLLITGGSMA